MEAIFSPQESSGQAEILAGVAGILAGAFLFVLALFRKDAPQVLGLLANVVYSALTFGALGAQLLILGGGTLMFAFANRESKPSKSTASLMNGHSGLQDLGDAAGHSDTPSMSGLGSRIGVVAFVQSLVLVALYSGFVQEFESNLDMQSWVRSNFPIGLSVLNWEGVLILSVFLGILLLQFLPGRFLSEQ